MKYFAQDALMRYLRSQEQRIARLESETNISPRRRGRLEVDELAQELADLDATAQELGYCALELEEKPKKKAAPKKRTK